MSRRKPPPEPVDGDRVAQLRQQLESAERMRALMLRHDPVAYNNGGTGGSDPDGTRARWDAWTDDACERVEWLRDRIAEEEAKRAAQT